MRREKGQGREVAVELGRAKARAQGKLMVGSKVFGGKSWERIEDRWAMGQLLKELCARKRKRRVW
jgi:hypothetical protein